MPNNVYNAYKKQSVPTMTSIELIVKLYDECERRLSRAVFFIENKDFENKNAELTRTLEIVEALQKVLDMDIPMSKNLDSLYNFFGNQLVQANLKNDIDVINSLIPQIKELREAFAQISRMTKEQIAMQTRQNAINPARLNPPGGVPESAASVTPNT